MKRKMVAWIMTTVMGVSLLAGCGSSGETTSTATEQESAEEAQDTSETADSSETAEAAETGTAQSAYGDVTANGDYNFYVIVKVRAPISGGRQFRERKMRLRYLE